MNDANPRQQIVDSIKNNSNILVTVSTSPSVDELSAALALTILLNNLSKRATAVVSGAIPPAITFLDPDKTFEDTVNSLRDFIIALDKEKADHLRYKVDGDVVKIFITPYRTTLTEKDLEFSQGDYNVEFVIALGVKDKEHLDKALDAHGRILHDATVATIMAGNDASNLGSITWQDPSASCLSEMLVSLTEALKDDKPVLDEQIATALLTGIVSATDRFSNNRTSSRIMTMAAQLMAAGANQQLIAAKLEEAHDIGPGASVVKPDQSTHADGTTSLSEGEGTKLGGGRKKAKKEKQPTDGLEITHEEKKPKSKDEKPTEQVVFTEPVAEETPAPVEEPTPEPLVVEPPTEQTPPEDIEQKLAAELGQLAPPEAPAPDLGQQLEEARGEEIAPESAPSPFPPMPPLDAPAPVEPAPQSPVFDFEALLPKTPQPTAPAPFDDQPPLPPVPPVDSVAAPTADISSTHNDSYVSGNASSNSPLNGVEGDAEPATVDPFAKPLVSPSLPPLQPDPLFDTQHADSVPATAATIQPPTDTSGMPDFEETPIPNDPAAVAAVPDFAAMNPTGLAEPSMAPPLPSLDSVPPPPPLPDFSNLPPLPPVPNLDPIASAAPPPTNLEDMFPAGQAVPAPAVDTAPAAPPPPGQFKIPGQ